MKINWSLLAKLPDGTIKEELSEIEKCLERIERVGHMLGPLAQFSANTDTETIIIANETVFTIGMIIDTEVDGVFHHLNQIFNSLEQGAGGESQAAAKGGE